MRDADRAGPRGDTRRVGASLFSGCCWFRQQAMLYVGVSVFGVKGCIWLVNRSLIFRGIGRLHQLQNSNSSGHHSLAGKGLELFRFSSLLDPYAGVVKRFVGVEGGARGARNLFFIFVTLQGLKNVLQNSCHHGESLPIQTQLFVASWFGGKWVVLLHPLCTPFVVW